MRFGHLFAAIPLAALTLLAVAPTPAQACWWKGGYNRSTYYAPAPAPYYYDTGPRPMPAVPAVPAKPTTVVSIGTKDNSFDPPTINVQPGTTIQWLNKGNHAHTVTSNDAKWDSGDLAPGAMYSVTFVTPGTYKYHCRHHKGMEGTIVVGKPATIPGGLK